MGRLLSESDLESVDNLRIKSGDRKRVSMRIGKITEIDLEENLVTLEWIYPQRGGVGNVHLTSPYVGFNSGIRFVPELNSIVAVGFSEDVPVLLTYYTPSVYSNMLMGIKNRLGATTNIRRLNPGEVSITSVDRAEIYIHDKIELTDKFADKIIIDPSDNSINLDSIQLYIKNEAGTLTMGVVKRDGEIITDDGKSVETLDGGHALTELKLKINKLADNTISTSAIENDTIAEVTVGTLVDDEGNFIYDQTGNKITVEVNTATGAKIVIDDAGKININEGNMIKPTDVSTRSAAAIKGVKDNFSPTDVQQRAARDGDAVSVPLSAGQVDLNHPDINTKAVANLAALSQLAPQFLVMGIPCVFVPAGVNLKLEAEIVEGSDTVFIGDGNNVSSDS